MLDLCDKCFGSGFVIVNNKRSGQMCKCYFGKALRIEHVKNQVMALLVGAKKTNDANVYQFSMDAIENLVREYEELTAWVADHRKKEK